MIASLRTIIIAFALFLNYASLLVAESAPHIEVMIPMRDGTLLPTSFYFPEVVDAKADIKLNTKYPCVLVRQPLGRQYTDPKWLELLKDGYIVAVQSTRSSCDPTGKTLPYLTDGWGELSDGYDTVEWLGNCEWTNGKIATIGSSATGITQLLLAPAQPPHLVCQHIEVAAPSLYQYAVWPGGQFRKEQVEGWLKVHRSDPSVAKWLHGQKSYDGFWSQFNSIAVAEKVQVPQAHIGGWYDIFLQGTLDAFQSAYEGANDSLKAQHKLVIGPWSHRWKQLETLGDFAAIKDGAEAPKPITCQAWLNHHMKGISGDLQDVPAIQYYVMGPFDGTPSEGNRWRSAHRWPPASIYAQMYLTKDKALCKTEPEKATALEKGVLDVAFNPEDPVPTIGGRNLFMASGPKDLRAIEGRSDVISFTTDALTEDTEITGKLAACLYASNVLQERDICCRLSDVYPDGKSILIAEGVAHIAPQADKDAGPQPILVDLWSTSMVFAKGHKIRLIVSGSNFPAFETSLAPNPDAKSNVCFSLHSGGAHASYLALPVINTKITQAS